MDPINWHSFFFLLFALVACSFAVAVVVSGNIVRMAFYLVISLGAVAGLFFLAGADFLGAMQLMVYVGGTLVLLVIACVGSITLLLAATIAITATDIKRVLAYSTVSQLGYMMLALGVGGWVAGLFHLLTHAFFKSLLFLCSGSVIHACHTNEMPEMGGLRTKMPWTAGTMLVGCLAISGAGIPLLLGGLGLSGFHSKDSILAQAFAFEVVNPSCAGLFFWIAGLSARVDREGIDGLADGSARWIRGLARLDDWIDRLFVDGLVNGIAARTYGLGLSLRAVQTGRLRQYVMLIAIGTVALFVLITLCWKYAVAGP